MKRLLPLLLLLPLGAQADPVRVGKFPAKIVPEQVVPLTFTAKGVITDLADPGTRLEAGTVIGVLNKESTEQEREDMELSLEREVLLKKDEMRRLTAQRSHVQFYLGLTDEERRFATQGTQSIEGEITQETLNDIDRRMDLLKREIDTIVRRKRSEFDHTHRDLTLRMPFTGRLQYNIPVPEDRSQPMSYNGNGYQQFATACDDSSYYITLAIGDSALTQLPERNFSATVSLPGKKELHGTYSHRKVERGNNGGDMLVYFFRLPEEEYDTAFSMLGSNTNAVLNYEAGDGVMHVSKASLVADPRAAECDDWEQLIDVIYPGYGIVIIAERSIIIRKL